MLDLEYPNDCGNAPKKKIILDFNIAFAHGDVEGVLAFLSPGAIWEVVGDNTWSGTAEIQTALKGMGSIKARKLNIQQIITHGKDASAHGVMEFVEGRIRFADFYEFTSAGSSKIKRMLTFVHSEGV